MADDHSRDIWSSTPPVASDQIACVREAFAGAYRAGMAPRIENYLEQVPAAGRRDLLEELLCVEFHFQLDVGHPLDISVYRGRFPGEERVIDAALTRYRRAAQEAETEVLSPSHSNGLVREAIASSSARAGDTPRIASPGGHEPWPEWIGRFQIRRCLGRGSFGLVFLAHDPQLDRPVALKVPRPELLVTDEQREDFLQEARTAAKLKHPHLVTVHDIQQEGDQIFIVQEYVEGCNLSQWARAGAPSWEDLTRRLIEITAAIGYVHQQGFCHRDIKPGNILIDSEGHAHVADFGLAVHENALHVLKGQAAGTPRYMAPEQVRGETHWIDGRTDIWALGVILYELLVGDSPFRGPTMLELFQDIQQREPEAPRKRNRNIPEELERICLRCLAKRRTHRYATASDLLDDLHAFLASGTDSAAGQLAARERATVSAGNVTERPTLQPAEDSTQGVLTRGTASGSQLLPRVVPKGLRAFDREDRDFFLELLPGPRDRHGLPDCVRFWKTWIERCEAEAAFSVGIMYGPSGCGKSSLVKAGLLPALADDVLPIVVEATPNDTEPRLLGQLRSRIPHLPAKASLIETLARLREGELTGDRKVLLVVDQFEQWLHASTNIDKSQLVNAIRQCDGAHIQCLILVRDDFWLSTTRFMQALEIPQVEGMNSALVDLFDPPHARRVLRAFGFAYGRLPEHGLSVDQQRFLDQAVRELAHDGKVICVQLALFADMMKGRDWVPASLQEVGGATGLGTKFLEETFIAPTAPPTHRLHAKAAQSVLKSLLPEIGTDIKGRMQSVEQLCACSGYAQRPDDFDDLLRILNNELRLITPADPGSEDLASPCAVPTADAASVMVPSAAPAIPHYQLTHDYLVPSLRDWMMGKQKQTRRGRAELRLAERAALWHAKCENQQLPSWWEYLSIRLLTDRATWTMPQRQMMGRGAVYFRFRAVWAAVILILLVVTGDSLRRQIALERRQLMAEGQIDALVHADVARVPDIVRQMRDNRRWIDPLLARRWVEAVDGSPEKRHLAMALLNSDPTQLDYLYGELLAASADQFPILRDFLAGHQPQLHDRLWDTLRGKDSDPRRRRLRAAAALAAFEPRDPRWNEVAAAVADQLVAVNLADIGIWQQAFRPVGDRLATPLSRIMVDAGQTELARSLATSLVVDYASGDPETLTKALVEADATTYAKLFPGVERQGSAAVQQLHQVLARRLEPDWNDRPLAPSWQQPTPDTRRTIELAQGVLDERCAFCQAMPWADFANVLDALKPCGYRPTRIRPYHDGNQLLVAAVWTRDGRAWQLERDLTAEQVRASASGQQGASDEWLPGDVAAYLPNDTSSPDQTRYVLLWSPPDHPGENRRVLVALGHPELEQLANTAGFGASSIQVALHVIIDAAGNRRYSGIWSDQGAPSTAMAEYDGRERTDQPQWDVCVADEGPLPDPLDWYRGQLARIEQIPLELREVPGLRGTLAAARYHLGELEPALSNLESILTQGANFAKLNSLRVLALARLQRGGEALNLLRDFYCGDPSSDSLRIQIQVMAWLGRWDEAQRLLQQALATAGKPDPDRLFDLACAAAVASAASEGDAKQTTSLREQSLDLLRQAIEAGFQDADQIRREIDLASLHADARFMDLLRHIGKPALYAALWRADTRYESRLVTGRSREEQLSASRQLLADGFRPVAWTVAAIGEPPRIESASVWHRPLIADDLKEELAMQQATAAVTLLRLGETAAVWPLLRHQPDPRLRSYLLDRLTSHGADPPSLWQRLKNEQEPSVRQALILGLGDFATAQLLPAAQRADISSALLQFYQTDPDPGVHSAAEWTLTMLGQHAELERIRGELASGDVLGERRWYVTNTNQHTMVTLHPEGPFLMGSPIWEAERRGGPTGLLEQPHWRRIGRRFAIGSQEITVEQFREFQASVLFNTEFSREEDAPINEVTWYQAARYCNWLSQQEGIPEDQWCYDPAQPFSDGMQLYDDYLSRVGYRLPTEAEWEYACRAGTTTARFFGESPALMARYAWQVEESQQRWTLPVASLRPNDFGLFDILGNVQEWCHNANDLTPLTSSLVEDSARSGAVRDHDSRRLRGGSFFFPAWILRSAYVHALPPDMRDGITGFRVARTLPALPATDRAAAQGTAAADANIR